MPICPSARSMFGAVTGSMRTEEQVVDGMAKAMSSLGLYIVLVFFAAQFVAYFKYTNLGLIFAIKGADLLRASGLGPIPLMLPFGLADTLFSTLDWRTALKTLRVYGRHVVRSLVL